MTRYESIKDVLTSQKLQFELFDMIFISYCFISMILNVVGFLTLVFHYLYPDIHILKGIIGFSFAFVFAMYVVNLTIFVTRTYGSTRYLLSENAQRRLKSHLMFYKSIGLEQTFHIMNKSDLSFDKYYMEINIHISNFKILRKLCFRGEPPTRTLNFKSTLICLDDENDIVMSNVNLSLLYKGTLYDLS